jgi:tetratricopeptide (TPR) repeat protein
LPFAWAAVPLTLVAVVVAFFVCDRFRVVMVPLFAVWAAAGVVWLVDSLRERRYAVVAIYGVLLCASAWAVNADLAGHRRNHSRAESNLRMGIFYAARGDKARAFAYYKMAVGSDPGFADGWNNLGVAQAQGGDLASARDSFEAALKAQPRHPKALGNLASLALQEGQHAEADSLARRTLRVAGRDPEALYNAAVVLGNLGDVGVAGEAFHQLVLIQPWNAAARLGEARALSALGRRSEAIEVLEAIPSDKRPEDVRAFLQEIGAP